VSSVNSEQSIDNEFSSDEYLPVPTADKSLTLAAKKLAGSAQCLNCGTELKGPFCYYCGQPDRNFMRFFPVLLRDLMEDLFDLDSRFMRTIKPLLFKPGRLTRDYMQGRRFRYAPPMRLYIFSSIVFFLLAALLSTDAVQIGNVENDGGFIHITADSEETAQIVEDALEKLPADVLEQIDVDQTLADVENTEEAEFKFDSEDFEFNGEPWNRETNPVDIKWLPDWLNDRINNEIEESPDKAKQINENPNLIIDKVFDILPATMFVLLPVVALIFKFWYLFAKRYYVEHLIFSLHNHSFLFVSLILIFLANLVATLLSNYGYTMAATAAEWLAIVISIWIPVYLLVSLRVVYQQNWLMTLGKFTLIGISYLTLLTIVTSGVAIASFVLL
jgi:hypothetical protein